VCIQKVVVVPVEWELQPEWAGLLEELICSLCSFPFGHFDMGPLVSLVQCMPPYGSNRAVQMCLQQSGVPERVHDRFLRNSRVPGDQLLIPIHCFPPGYNRYGLAKVEIVLPVCKVQCQIEVVPDQNAGEACAKKLRVRWVNVGIRILVDAELRPACRVSKYVCGWRAEFREQFREREALRKDRVALLDDHIADDARVRVHDGVEAVVYEGEVEHFAGTEKLQSLEYDFCGQLSEVDNGVALFVARRSLAVHALGALVVERYGDRLVLERRIVVFVADMAWHADM
jgi:hypothetical protein